MPKRTVVDVVSNVARTPELRCTPNGTAICNVRLAVNGEDGQTRWISIAARGSLAEIVARVQEGDRLGVRGPMGQRQ